MNGSFTDVTARRARVGRERDAGFTLIEVLIVIVILGVLAGIVVFSVAAVTDRGQESACETDERALQVAVEAFYSQEGVYPTSQTDISPRFLRDESELYEVGSGGVVTPVAGSGCT